MVFPTSSGRVVLVGRAGPVNILEPRVSISVAGHDGECKEVEPVIDTGFSSWLTLPGDLIQELRLTAYGNRPIRLADASVVYTQTFSALVQWQGHLRPIIVHQADGELPLLGTALLENYRLTVDMREDGLVTIGPIP